jgi:hypothetical protein
MLPQRRLNQVARLSRGRLAPCRRLSRRRPHNIRLQPANLARESADAGRWEHYEVPFEPGQSVLDGLRWIRPPVIRACDPVFCINANAWNA